ncbi:MAG TPA: hypothetical protein VKR54_02665 [Candidatus Babeliales bacterium]|nr:hypothetical protein [Candidatus Babeliales bacterium]
MHYQSKTFLFFLPLLFLSFFSHMHASTPPMYASTPPIYHNNYNPHNEVHPHITAETHPHIEVHPHITVASSSALSIKISDIYLECKNKFEETITQDNYYLLKNLIKKILWQYRYVIACGTIVGSYGIASLLLLTDYYHYLHSNTLWARWKPEYSFEILCTMPQKDLTKALIADINTQHYNQNNPTDFAHPLTLFITTIDGEIKVCKRYLATAKTIKSLCLMKIFPTDDAKIDEISKLLERALFIKHLFLSWLSDYNIASNQKM